MNGQGTLERLWGHGRRSVGGHPEGLETWCLRRPASDVSTDGFSYTHYEGELVEDLCWAVPEGHRSTTSRRTFHAKGWLGSIVIGMPKTQALRKATSNLGPATYAEGVYTWKEKGWARAHFLQGPDYLDTWTASLSFDSNSNVESIQLSVEGPRSPELDLRPGR